MDAMTGNLTDFDRKGGKTVGPTRAITGIADLLTGNMFDLDKRGGLDLLVLERKKRKILVIKKVITSVIILIRRGFKKRDLI